MCHFVQALSLLDRFRCWIGFTAGRVSLLAAFACGCVFLLRPWIWGGVQGRMGVGPVVIKRTDLVLGGEVEAGTGTDKEACKPLL